MAYVYSEFILRTNRYRSSQIVVNEPRATLDSSLQGLDCWLIRKHSDENSSRYCRSRRNVSTLSKSSTASPKDFAQGNRTAKNRRKDTRPRGRMRFISWKSWQMIIHGPGNGGQGLLDAFWNEKVAPFDPRPSWHCVTSRVRPCFDEYQSLLKAEKNSKTRLTEKWMYCYHTPNDLIFRVKSVSISKILEVSQRLN